MTKKNTHTFGKRVGRGPQNCKTGAKFQSLISRKRCGHWILTSFGAVSLNQSVYFNFNRFRIASTFEATNYLELVWDGDYSKLVWDGVYLELVEDGVCLELVWDDVDLGLMWNGVYLELAWVVCLELV